MQKEAIPNGRQVYEFISKQMNDPIVEWRTCSVSGEDFPIYQKDQDFYNKVSPTFNGVKLQIPRPNRCFTERAKTTASWRNMNKFYRRTCDFSGKNIISLHSKEKPYQVYDRNIWWSDKWDPMDYAYDWNPNQPFFQQFDEFIKKVPHMALINQNTENAEYVNSTEGTKNSYMSAIVYYDSEDIYYSYWVINSNWCCDCLYCLKCEKCLECSDCNKCFECAYCNECVELKYCMYSTNLQNCDHCFLCSNLVNKSYCIQNKQYTKEEYQNEIAKISTGVDFKKQYDYLLNTRMRKSIHILNGEKCFGNKISDSKECALCFNVNYSENVRYTYGIENAQDCYDVMGGTVALGYNCSNVGLGTTTHVIGCMTVRRSHHMYYCMECFDCSYCFGCSGLRNKQYCIFNKQYTKQEREEKVAQIGQAMVQTGEWGEFFPGEMSPFGFNETIAQDYFQLSKEEALQQGFKWYDEPQLQQLSNLPEGVVLCKQTGKPFRLMSKEKELCTVFGISFPTKHPDIRHRERWIRMAKNNLYMRNCDKTGKEILSVYPQDASFKVYSQETYDKQVYG